MTAPLTAARFEPHVGTAVRVEGVWDPDTDGIAGPAPTVDTRTEAPADPATDVPAADPGTPLELEIVKVNVLDVPGPFEQFSVRLRGDRARSLDQGTYVVTHPALGRQAMFVVPRREDDDHRFYDAVYSVPRPPGSDSP